MGWEPWTGCYKISDGCTYCYYYGKYSKRQNENNIVKTKDFFMPLEKNLNNEYRVKSNATLSTCFTTDFFLPETDEWRIEAWKMIKERSDVKFLILTKRIDRFYTYLPKDWGDGYSNVIIGCTCENQILADYRLPLFLSLPIKHRFISCTPLLSNINLAPYLHGIEHVTAGGESSKDARPCNYNWVLNIRNQCKKAGISFWFKNTGSKIIKSGVLYKVPRYKEHAQAKKANINIVLKNDYHL
jgi:protein gp37